MGACSSTSKAAAVHIDPGEGRLGLAIIVRGGRGLSGKSEKQSDPYVMLRIGETGSTWERKSETTERHSRVVYGSNTPVWDLVAFVTVPSSQLSTMELHLKVNDRDIFTMDDRLGEARVPLAPLHREGKEQEVTLVRSSESATPAFISVACTAPDSTLAREMAQHGVSHGNHNHTLGWLGAMGQYYSTRADDARYYLNMVRYLLVSQAPHGTHEWWLGLSRSVEGSTPGVSIAEFPRPRQVVYIGHAEVYRRLAELPAVLGTDNANGHAYRENFLGIQELNNAMWPEQGPNATIGIGMGQEGHAFVRPLLDRMVGPVRGNWSVASVQAAADGFWRGRRSLYVSGTYESDVKLWVFRMLHRIHLDIELTDDEALAFSRLQGRMLLAIGVPPSAVTISLIRSALKVD